MYQINVCNFVFNAKAEQSQNAGGQGLGNETCFRIGEHENNDTSHIVHLLLKYNYATRNQTIARSLCAFTHASLEYFLGYCLFVVKSVKDVSDSYSGSVVLNRKQNVLVLQETRCTTCDVMTTCIDEDYHEQNDRLASCIIRRFPVSLFIPERSTLQ